MDDDIARSIDKSLKDIAKRLKDIDFGLSLIFLALVVYMIFSD